ncbi:hypothetical protein TWF102_007053 [Orbilia oligospora]|uniref:Aminoglycoside phosphotransferase domain-containing protein n=1 Tax=Orbilia oligospora TaxID=2813651 RepID=A0A7C8JFZ7_ORBOL|nr:hypothetical protein TWF102_007053 [Orbilia oligospora]KAF3114322.1 hypothetical protein TWF706_008256 [Orbilia oligospora]KAF3150009.1 hypothetical protein TWF594_009915 [Orbilia oligospora]
MSAIPLPEGKGKGEPSPLEGYTKDYKEAKQTEKNQEPTENMKLVLQWVNTVEATDEQNITESDILASIDTASTSSTNYYGQEAFKHFQPKLFKLLASIIPREVHLSMVGRMKGGGNNRVAGIRFDWPSGKICKLNGKVFFQPQEDDTEVRAVFRTCRWPSPEKSDPEIMDNYAILTELSRVGLKVPIVIAYDSTPWNSMSVPFMLLERLPGFRLEDIYGSLTLKQKEQVARLVAEQLNIFDTIRNGKMGRIQGGQDCIPVKRTFQPEIPKDFKMITLDFVTGRQHKLHVKPSRSIYTVMRRMFNNWISIIKKGDIFKDNAESLQEIYLHLFEELRAILEVMKLRGFFEGQEGNIALHHPDFFARNIIIGASCRRPDNLDFQIEGVIDWDEALYLPEVLRCSPCSWLWELAGPQVTNLPAWEEYYGDSDELPSGRFDFRLNPDERKIKTAYDEVLSQTKRDFMYKVENVWIRRLWKFALSGVYLSNEHDVNRFTRFLENWAVYVKATRHRFNDPNASRYVKISPELAQQIRKHIKVKSTKDDTTTKESA